MPSTQAENLIKTTLETYSSGASHLNSILLWSQFQDRTEGNAEVGFWEEENLAPFFSEKNGRETSFHDLNSTRADTPKLSRQEEILRKLQWSNYVSLSRAFKDKLQIISAREDNWDGKESKKTNRNALNRASTTLDDFLMAVIDSGRVWRMPFVSSDEEGQITIEWKNGKQELHIEISEDAEEYIKVWGTNIEHEMHLGFLKPSEYVTLWDWLN